MSELISQISKTRENQRLFIGTTEVPGVQSIRFDYNSNGSLVKYLGQNTTPVVPRGGQFGTVSVNSLLISNDIFYPLTGNSGVNGVIIENKSNGIYSSNFVSGYLSSYSCRYQIGSPPEINTSFTVLGNLGRVDNEISSALIESIKTSNSNLMLKIPGPGGIDLNISEFETNRILACEVQVNCLRLPNYVIGNREPTEVLLSTPLEVFCNFQIEVNDYELKNFQYFPFSEPNQDISFTIRTFNTNEIINSYLFKNMSLNSEAYETNVNGAAAVNIQYRGYI
jgi:hypothetical protein